MHKARKQLMACAAVMIMVAASCCIAMDQAPEEQESDALVPLAVAFVAVCITSAIALHQTFKLAEMGEQSGVADQDRTAESALVAQSIAAGLTYYDNALANYDQVWTLTDEHWIRQAELAAAGVWKSGEIYDPYEVLVPAGVYLNSAYMLKNATAQINSHYDSMSDRLTAWQSLPTYAGHMSLRTTLGDSTSLTSSESWGLSIGSVIRDVKPVADIAHIVSGDLWASQACTITSMDGTQVSLQDGWTDLSSTSFTEGVYDLPAGVTLCGNILPVLGTGAAPVSAGMVAEAGSQTKVLTLTGGKISDGSTSYDKISLQVVPDSGTVPAAVDITGTLTDYAALMATVYDSMAKASSSASVVWGIYDKAGSASEYLTTLIVPDTYENIKLSNGQKSIITTLAMEQLADYYQENGGKIKAGSYVMTDDSMQLFCRGDVTTAAGKLYKDVIFSPVFYKDTSLANGANSFKGAGFVAIWGAGEPLTTWNKAATANDSQLIYLADGADIQIYEMEYKGAIADTVDLKVSEIEIIEPGAIDSTPIEPQKVNKMVEIVEIVMILIGIIALIIGAVYRNPIFLIVGGIVAALGLFAPEQVAAFLDGLGISMWEYP